MPKFGLKLWSTNADAYLPAAERLYGAGVFDYLELFVVPGSADALSEWQALRERSGIPFVIHNAHSACGFNLAKRECEAHNREIYAESRAFADALEAKHVIFHGGTDGSEEETVRQLKGLGESRALVENKPFVPLRNPLGVKFCRGATAEELERIVGETGCGFCLDVGHAICSANSQGLEPYAFVRDLSRRLSPAMYHLSGVDDMRSVYDSHPHLEGSALDLARICREVFPANACISIETAKDFSDGLDDFAADVEYLRRFLV